MLDTKENGFCPMRFKVMSIRSSDEGLASSRTPGDEAERGLR